MKKICKKKKTVARWGQQNYDDRRKQNSHIKKLDEGVKSITNIHWAKLLDIALVNDTNSSGTIYRVSHFFILRSFTGAS